jgi:two-component system, chemotaxis family, sensor kinase CheA
MDLTFDIEQDELPIFLAETEEQLLSLDDGLVRLEREENNPELVQTLFRAAHTLKGTAGMIGHKRMVTLTHALETALDGVRKNQYPVTTFLVDLCLHAVDALRLLRDEVTTGQASDVSIEALTEPFSKLVLPPEADTQKRGPSTTTVLEVGNKLLAVESKTISDGIEYHVVADISQTSFASAARALQIVLTLQEFGTIIHCEPTQQEIEAAKPVHRFKASFQTTQSLEVIRPALGIISEIDKIYIGQAEDQPVAVKPLPAMEAQVPVSETTKPPRNDTQNASGNVERSQAPQSKPAVEKTLRTSVERLDNLMNLVGELITDRNRLYQIRSQFETRMRGDDQVDVLAETVTHIGRITDQLQHEVMSIRMLPISNVFNKFPRMVRDLANKFGKKIDLVIEGEDTELDRSVIEEITDPLIHLLRNAVDHGVEKPEDRIAVGKPEMARVMLTARHEQGHIVLTVEDNGKGIDIERVKASAVQKGMITEAEAATLTADEAINLIFSSGLSTAKSVSDISGRGVGLDIVRNNIQHLNGSILVETWPGEGSRFQITLPLTLAIVPTLLVKVGLNIFAIPLVTVLETLRIQVKDIQTISSKPVILLRNKVLPLISLKEAFNLPGVTEQNHYQHIVVVGSGKMNMGLVVDSLLGQEEVVVKSLGPLVGEVTGIASAAILGDGHVILIVDVQDLFRLAGLLRDR